MNLATTGAGIGAGSVPRTVENLHKDGESRKVEIEIILSEYSRVVTSQVPRASFFHERWRERARGL